MPVRNVMGLCLVSLSLLTGCTLTQQPATVASSAFDSTAPTVAPQTASVEHAARPMPEPVNQLKPKSGKAVPSATQSESSVKSLKFTDLLAIAKQSEKSPTSARQHAGEVLAGQAKFVRSPKGNPNAAVADIRVTGLGEVSLWCRNSVNPAPFSRLTAFEGSLTGSVYTSEDFSHDVFMKECRFSK